MKTIWKGVLIGFGAFWGTGLARWSSKKVLKWIDIAEEKLENDSKEKG